MNIKATQEQNIVRLELSGDVDESGAEKLKAEFGKLNLSSTKEVVIDFSKVNYIGSSGIGKLLLFYKNLAVHGGRIRIENTNGPIYDLFHELKLDSILTINR